MIKVKTKKAKRHDDVKDFLMGWAASWTILFILYLIADWRY